MYRRYSNTTLPCADYQLSSSSPPDFMAAPLPLTFLTAPAPPPPPPPPTHLLINIPDDHQLSGLEIASGHSSSSSNYGSPSSMQRSISSHSLQKNNDVNVNHFYAQHGNKAESPLSIENSLIIRSMRKARKYSPEEKKKRIERYRSKRNRRNFTKKIMYECRKTLADSRTRVRGRFARNDETEKDPQLQWSNISGEEGEEDDDNWVNFLDAFSASSIP